MNTGKMEAFKAEVQAKINNLLIEFAEGKLNREQFYAIYERYNGQIELVEKAIQGTGDVSLEENQGGTILLREKFMGKARGLMLFENKNGATIETLGVFNVDMAKVQPILHRFMMQVREGHTLERIAQQVGENQWLLFMAGDFTTVVTLFEHEPSRYQITVIQRMQQEFENGNKRLFQEGIFTASRLIYPFMSFVHRNLKATS